MAHDRNPTTLPLKRRTLHDEIVERLRDIILNGVYAPGQTIPEMDLCAELQISRTPLREALKVLAADDFVTLLPNRGSVVREVIPEEIAEVFEMMEALEALVGKLVVERASDGDIAELQLMHQRMVACKEAGDRQGYFNANQAVHRRIAEMSGNRVLAQAYGTYADKIKRARYLANSSDVRWSESVEEHAAFMKALAARDTERFVALLTEHSCRTGKAVVAALHAMPKSEPEKKTRRR